MLHGGEGREEGRPTDAFGTAARAGGRRGVSRARAGRKIAVDGRGFASDPSGCIARLGRARLSSSSPRLALVRSSSSSFLFSKSQDPSRGAD